MLLQQPLAEYNGAPQTEDGFTRIANELLQAIIINGFTSRQLNVIFAIIRCTYGFNKKSDAVSGYQIAKMTNIDRSHISKTINELVKMNVITRLKTGRESHGIFVNEIAINKYYDTWLTVAKKATVAKIAPMPKSSTTVTKLATVTVAELAKPPLPKQPTHKDNTKDIKDNTKEILFPGVSPDILKQWFAVRKKKRAVEISDIVYKAMIRESGLAGISLEEAVIVCIEKNWIAFDASWYKPNGKMPSKKVSAMDISQYDHTDTGSNF
jgi:phage replication O-like protein O